MSPRGRPGPGGLVLVDKPAGMTSHDVVARVRRLAGTRRVGHAGTLDPMATGLLVLGLDRATRLLGHLAGAPKTYEATIRLGASTDSDDATGTTVATADARGVTAAGLAAAIGSLTGPIRQVPSTISAIKVDGERAYRRARAGEDVQLAAREVTVTEFVVLDDRAGGPLRDLDVRVTCTSGTYIRALARDLGAALAVGGHLTRLCRTRVGTHGLDAAHTLAELEAELTVVDIGTAAAAAFPRLDVDAEAGRIIVHGGWVPASCAAATPAAKTPAETPLAVFGPDGQFLALVEEAAGRVRPLAVFAPPE